MLFGAALILALIAAGTRCGYEAWAAGSGGPTAPDSVSPASPQHDPVALRIAGDEILASTVVPEISRNYLERRGARAVQVTAAAAPWTTEISGRLLNGDRLVVLVRSSSTEEGFRQLADRAVDIALAGRQITPEEARVMPSLGDILDPAASLAIARTAVVVVVNATNPLEAVTLRQLRDIYAGTVTDWEELGGNPGKIHVFSRQMSSTVRDLFDSAVMGATPISPSVRPFATFAALRSALSADPNGIGYLAVPKGLKELRIDVRGQEGVSPPNNYVLASGDYPVNQVLYLYRWLGSENPEVPAFFREAVSISSQVDVMAAGLSGLAPQLLVPENAPPSSDTYQALTRNGLRVSTTIRFADGSAEIDAAASRELDALSVYLRRLQVSGHQLIHIAFSEDTGDQKENIAISQRLGQIVIDELRKRKVVTGDVAPLGADRPLASESTAAGRGLNRRVETWIRP